MALNFFVFKSFSTLKATARTKIKSLNVSWLQLQVPAPVLVAQLPVPVQVLLAQLPVPVQVLLAQLPVPFLVQVLECPWVPLQLPQVLASQAPCQVLEFHWPPEFLSQALVFNPLVLLVYPLVLLACPLLPRQGRFLLPFQAVASLQGFR